MKRILTIAAIIITTSAQAQLAEKIEAHTPVLSCFVMAVEWEPAVFREAKICVSPDIICFCMGNTMASCNCEVSDKAKQIFKNERKRASA